MDVNTAADFYEEDAAHLLSIVKDRPRDRNAELPEFWVPTELLEEMVAQQITNANLARGNA